MTQTPPGGITATAACELARVTLRQLDYWARRGWVSPSVDTGLGRAGRRLYDPSDVVRLAALGHFGQAGLDVGRLGPALADLDLPLGSDFLVVAEADGAVAVCPASGCGPNWPSLGRGSSRRHRAQERLGPAAGG